MKNALIAAGAVAVALSGCAAGPAPKAIPVSGSKADATVTMSAVYSPSLHDGADWSRANSDATERCQAWGYDSAVPFGSEFERCEVWTGGLVNFCAQMSATRTYQCVGETK